MALTTAQKFKIQAGYTLLTIDAPPGLADILDLPQSVKISGSAKAYQQIHWFVKSRDAMEKALDGVLSKLKPGVICWIYFPKGSSGVQTDLTRDKGWDRLKASKGLQWLSLVSLDATWSAFAIRQDETGAKKPAATKRKDDAHNVYIDPVRKQVRLPDDVAIALKKHLREAAYFESLAYSHKKEYVQWITGARKEETRIRRINEMIERLKKHWKNPSNN